MQVSLEMKTFLVSEKCNNFRCSHCKTSVGGNENMGTMYRNHCPSCLYSRHVDLERSGDRKAKCKSKMEPIGLTYKGEGKNKYGEERIGELMLIHRCCNEDCEKISINRLAADDSVDAVIKIFTNSLSLEKEFRNTFNEAHGIYILDKDDWEEVNSQLKGNGNNKLSNDPIEY